MTGLSHSDHGSVTEAPGPADPNRHGFSSGLASSFGATTVGCPGLQLPTARMKSAGEERIEDDAVSL